MRYSLKLVTPPTAEPIDLAAAKTHLRVDQTDEDALVQGLVMAAREYVEAVTDRALMPQTWDMERDEFAGTGNWIELPRYPLQSITSISYTDSAGATTTMPTSDYLVDTVSEPGRAVPAYGKTWPAVTLRPIGAVTIRFVAGYATAATVPQSIKQALLLLMGHWYENREGVVTGTISKPLEFALDALLGLYKPLQYA